jgi:hypothetical protein
MADYLANVIARNLEVADRLQPRATSAFEPANGPGRDVTSADPIQFDQFEQHVFVDPTAPSPVPQSTDVPSRMATHPETPMPSRRRQGDAIRLPRITSPGDDRPQPTVMSGDERKIGTPIASRRQQPKTTVPTAPTPMLPRRTGDGTSAAAKDLSPAPPITSRTPAPVQRREQSAGAVPQGDGGSSTPPPANRANSSRDAAHITVDRIVNRVHGEPTPTATNEAASHDPHRETRSIDAPPVDRSLHVDADTRTAAAPRTPVSSAAPPTTHVIREVARNVVNALQPERGAASQSPVAVHARLRQPLTADASVPPFATPEAPATIHVTIGRVEVRATPEPVRTAAGSTTPAASGLDDYLRKRAEGSGR